MHIANTKHARKSRKRQASGYVKSLDRVTFVVGIIGPFTVIPQAYTIFSTQSAQGVSLTTWFLIFLMTLPWILYGLAHKDKLILTCFALWGTFDLLVVIGTVLYS